MNQDMYKTEFGVKDFDQIEETRMKKLRFIWVKFKKSIKETFQLIDVDEVAKNQEL